MVQPQDPIITESSIQLSWRISLLIKSIVIIIIIIIGILIFLFVKGKFFSQVEFSDLLGEVHSSKKEISPLLYCLESTVFDESCVSLFESLDETECSQMENLNDSCYYKIALYQKNILYCNSIVDISIRDECETSLSLLIS